MSIQYAPAPAQARPIRPIADVGASAIRKAARAARTEAAIAKVKDVSDGLGEALESMKAARDARADEDEMDEYGLDPTPTDEIPARPPCDGGRIPGRGPVQQPAGFRAWRELTHRDVVDMLPEERQRLFAQIDAAPKAYSGARHALLTNCVLNRNWQLRRATLDLAAWITWHYPCKAWRIRWTQLRLELAMAPRTMRLAKQQLIEAKVLATVEDGAAIILPDIEACKPPDKRHRDIKANQLNFASMHGAPLSVLRFFGLEPVRN